MLGAAWCTKALRGYIMAVSEPGALDACWGITPGLLIQCKRNRQLDTVLKRKSFALISCHHQVYHNPQYGASPGCQQAATKLTAREEMMEAIYIGKLNCERMCPCRYRVGWMTYSLVLETRQGTLWEKNQGCYKTDFKLIAHAG